MEFKAEIKKTFTGPDKLRAVEHCVPMTKELRAQLSAAVLEAYEAAVQHEEAAVS